MLLGYEVVYQIGLLDDGFWLLLIGAPVLLFLGYQLANLLTTKKPPITPMIVLPLDTGWEPYTNNREIIMDITKAVIKMHNKGNYDRSRPITYSMFRYYLHSKEADAIARLIPEYGLFSA